MWELKLYDANNYIIVPSLSGRRKSAAKLPDFGRGGMAGIN